MRGFFRALIFEPSSIPLQERSIVGEVRQLGIMAASELVADKKSKKIDSQRIQKKNAAFSVCFVGYPEEIRQIPP